MATRCRAPLVSVTSALRRGVAKGSLRRTRPQSRVTIASATLIDATNGWPTRRDSRRPVRSGGLGLEDDPGGDAPGLDVCDRLVNLVERARLADDRGLAGGVEL